MMVVLNLTNYFDKEFELYDTVKTIKPIYYPNDPIPVPVGIFGTVTEVNYNSFVVKWDRKSGKHAFIIMGFFPSVHVHKIILTKRLLPFVEVTQYEPM